MKIVLIKYPGSNNDYREIKIEDEIHTLDEALDLYENFLKACGFVPTGMLEFVDYEECEEDESNS